MNTREFSPLRYPGGKSRISFFIEDMILLNNLEDATFYEAYAGGAGLSLNILFSNLCKRIVLNDLDYHIYAFWYSILNRTDEFIAQIEEVDIDINNWELQKEVYLNYKKYDVLEVGFSAFFLNRCNRSGILNAGPIGGRNQDGNYSIDVRFNKLALIGRINRIAERKDQIEITNMESINFLSNILGNKVEDQFMFLDPPYYTQGANLYFNYYMHDDHKKLAELLKSNHDANWYLTYDNCESINALYNDCKRAYLPMTYTLQEKRKSKEVMIFSDNLYIPSQLRLGSNTSEIKLIDQINYA